MLVVAGDNKPQWSKCGEHEDSCSKKGRKWVESFYVSLVNCWLRWPRRRSCGGGNRWRRATISSVVASMYGACARGKRWQDASGIGYCEEKVALRVVGLGAGIFKSPAPM